MYNKLIQKYYIIKLFGLFIPKTTSINKVSFYLCKYTINKTPYGNIECFIKELYKILSVFKLNSYTKNVLFLCTNKIYNQNIKSLAKINPLDNINNNNNNIMGKKFSLKKISFIIMCDTNYNLKKIAFFKDQKIPSIGFTNLTTQPNITDFTLLLECRFFSSIFFLHFLLKKLL